MEPPHLGAVPPTLQTARPPAHQNRSALVRGLLTRSSHTTQGWVLGPWGGGHSCNFNSKKANLLSKSFSRHLDLCDVGVGVEWQGRRGSRAPEPQDPTAAWTSEGVGVWAEPKRFVHKACGVLTEQQGVLWISRHEKHLLNWMFVASSGRDPDVHICQGWSLDLLCNLNPTSLHQAERVVDWRLPSHSLIWKRKNSCA